MAKKQAPYRTKMWAVMRDGECYMILPDLGEAETHYGSLSLNGYSKHKWDIKPVTVTFSPETAAERRARLDRAVQATVELNRRLSQRAHRT